MFTNHILESFDKIECVLGIFIDFREAFDTIDHIILCEKLKQYNFSNLAVQWVQDYLTNRTQITKINESFSKIYSTVTCGVPQGSILGPSLFLLRINDIFPNLKYLISIPYADDTNLFLNLGTSNRHFLKSVMT